MATEERKIHIAIIEDEPEIALRIERALARDISFQYLKTYTTAESAIAQIATDKPDMLILDLGLPGMRGEAALPQLFALLPQLRVMAYTVFENEETILQAIENGVHGYITKDTPEDLFLAELKVISLGGSTLTPRVAHKIIKNFKPFHQEAKKIDLSQRELEVLNLVSLGLLYADIAEELEISLHTVRRHIENIYRKLNVNTRSQAILKGIQTGVLDLSE